MSLCYGCNHPNKEATNKKNVVTQEVREGANVKKVREDKFFCNGCAGEIERQDKVKRNLFLVGLAIFVVVIIVFATK